MCIGRVRGHGPCTRARESRPCQNGVGRSATLSLPFSPRAPIGRNPPVCRHSDHSKAPCLVRQPPPTRWRADGGRVRSGDTDSLQEPAEEQRQNAFSRALLLSFLASQNRSLFGAKCMVDTLIEVYRSGYTLEEIQLMMTLAAMGKLTPILQDVLLAWAAVVMMTLQAVGVPLYAKGEARMSGRGKAGLTEDTGAMTQGLRNMVQGCVDRFLGGETLFRLQLQQSMAGQVEGDAEAAGVSPGVLMMQQNTRLAIITLEVVRDAGLTTEVALVQALPPMSATEESEDEGEEAGGSTASARGHRPPLAGVDFITGFLEHGDGSGSSGGGGGAAQVADGAAGHPLSPQQHLRSAAVRLLVAFMGAALGSNHSAWVFVEEAARCYCQGWTADDLFLSLHDEEFAQSGGVLPIGVARLPGSQNVSATLFARWLSVIYISLAQLGVRHPGATEQVGWAWVCSLDPEDNPGSMEAHGVADFVSATLRLAAQEDGKAVGLVDGGVMLNMLRAPPGGEGPLAGLTAGAGIEDPELSMTSSFALIMRQQISLVRMARELVLAQAEAQEEAARRVA